MFYGLFTCGLLSLCLSVCLSVSLIDKLHKIRREFVDKVSLPLLKQLLDDLLDDKVINDGQKESVLEENPTKTDKARSLIDIIKKKGNRASNLLITHLEERDPTLYAELGLSSDKPDQPGQFSSGLSVERHRPS